MTSKTRTFVPYDGKLREMDPRFALALKDAPRKGWRPDPIAVRTEGVNSAVRMWVVMERPAAKFGDVTTPKIVRATVAMVTTQARKLAESSIAVSAVFAFVAFGLAAARETN